MVYLDLPSIGTEGSLGPGVNRLSSLWCLWIWMVSFQALFPSSAIRTGYLYHHGCHGRGRGRAGTSLSGELTFSLSQGSLLKVVLEDYLRLKKLFAQRMLQKASSCHSSISEVVR